MYMFTFNSIYNYTSKMLCMHSMIMGLTKLIGSVRLNETAFVIKLGYNGLNVLYARCSNSSR